ncbi:DEKNAAC105681 [Brettanomyces naardenensis]|uniref:DEKNAAC105681 n=1 Tax=Brettanomyces naardenensis TaxID=13370 RepID=A0A448YTY4_BRENA|nr:DEKNAAC105681 [Brettanomyces naardenensis]
MGKLIHYAVDLTLLTAVLAGVKKSSGVEPNVDLIKQQDLNKYTKKYLELGDTLFDKAVDWMGQSSYFVRK